MMAAEKPTIRPFDGSAIPQALKDQRRWAPWRAVFNAKKNKYDKVPHRADRPEYGISSAKPEQWFSFSAALAAYRKNPKLFAGVGYVMTGPHGVVGTDLDHCVEGGVVAPWAAEVVAQLDSYTEISPSGRGLRVLSFGEQPTDWVNHDIGIEIYGGNEARFLTVTGEHLAGSPLEVRAAGAGALQALESRYAKERRKADVIDLNMPEVLDDLMLPQVADLDVPPATRDLLIDGLHSGDRSRALFAAAVALYSAGLADDEVFSVLANSPHALEIALDHRRQDHDRALLYIWREHCCKGKARAAELAPLSLNDFDVLPDEEGDAPAPKVKAARFQFKPAAEFVASRGSVAWAIKGVLPRSGLCVLFGESGSGKSFLMLDLVGAIARGIEWRDKKVVQGSVAYVCAEGGEDFKLRMSAYAEHHGVALSDLPIFTLDDAPNFMQVQDIKDLVTSLRTLGSLSAIVVDTTACVMPGSNENSGEDMGKLVAHCKALTRATGALVVLVHHSGKDVTRGARGWSGLRAAADTEITVERAGDDRAATITKMKGGRDGAEFGFKLNTVTMGQDEDGEDVTSCVLEHTQAVPRSERKREPKGAIEKIVLQVARRLEELSGEAVHHNTLLECAVNEIVRDPEAKRDRRRELVGKAITSLQAANHLSNRDGVVSVL